MNLRKEYNFPFNIGEIVYLKTDNEQQERIIVQVNIREDGISYILVSGTIESLHFGFETTRARDIVKVTSN